MEGAETKAIVYRLDEQAIRRRALAIAFAESAAMLAPAALVTLLLAREGAFSSRPVVVAAALLVLLATVRVLGVRARIMRRLDAFEVRLDAATLAVTRLNDSPTYPTSDILRVVTLPGALRGLRIFVGSPRQGRNDHLSIDVPSGGARFGELRVALGNLVYGHAATAAMAPGTQLTRAPFAHRVGYAGRVSLMVAALVFAPFVVDDLLTRSRAAAYFAVVLVGVVLRWNVRRSSMG